METKAHELEKSEQKSLKARRYYENQSERYGDIAEVTIRDYQALNPEGHFSQTPYGIFENDADGRMIEQLAVITSDFKNPAATALGSIRSERKAAAARENGKLGGRPKKA